MDHSKMEDEALERLCRAVFNGCKRGESSSSSSSEMEEARNGEDDEEKVGQVRVGARRHRLTLFSIQLSASIVSLVLLLLLFEGQLLSEMAAASPAAPAGGALAYDRLEPAPGQTTRAARQQQLQKLLEAAHGSTRLHQLARQLSKRDFRLLYPPEGARERRDPADSSTSASSKSNQTPLGHYNGTNVVIKAFNYRFSLDLELNSNLFKDNLIQKHILPNGALLSDSSKLQHCYYHARSRPEARPQAIGAFRTCQPGLSGIIHLDNESFVIHPFYETNLSKRHPHIIYRYQSTGVLGGGELASGDAEPAQEEGGRVAECGNSHLHEWALRRFVRSSSSSSTQAPLKGAPSSDANAATSDGPPHQASASYLLNHDWQPSQHTREPTRNRKERDYRLATEKYIELALVLSRDMFDKRNTTSPLEVLHDALQIVNCLDLYFRSANTRVALIYIETWPYADQIDIGPNSTETLMEFWKYSARKFWHVGYDAAHLLTGAHLAGERFSNAEIGISWPGSICTPQGVSVSQEPASLFEPFLAAATMAHMLGHNLNMDHDLPVAFSREVSPPSTTVRPTAAPEASSEDSDEEQVRGRSVANSGGSLDNSPDEQPTDCPGSCLMSPQFNQIRVPIEQGSVWQQEQVSLAQMEPEEGSQTLPAFLRTKSNSFASLPFKFSKQSLKGYHKMINTNQAVCLFNQPGKPETFQNCGNGIVEPGEDCDCGGSAECLESPDDCCDRITCRFKPDVQCISGSCCERCRLRAAGSVCRRARSDCDLAEVCDGKSSQCAPDLHKLNGHPCHNDTGYCYLGQCPSHESQCRDLWGDGASQANQVCFAQLNSNGTHRGNCGTSSLPTQETSALSAAQPTKRHYKRCELANIMCGTLQCQLGDMRPVIGAPLSVVVAHSLKSLKSSDGASIECKALEPEASLTTGTGASQQQQGNKLRQLAYVRDGTKCGPGSVCFNQSCQLITSVFRKASELCPHDEAGQVCSGNGLCSSAFRCHCNPEWLGHDCSQRMPTKLLGSRKDGSIKMLVESTELKTNLKGPAVAIHLVQPQSSLPPPLLPMPPPPLPPTIQHLAPQQSATASAQPAPSQPQTGTQSANSVTMEKTSEAIGAPTLVFILVSIVAAVYVGFALMANCYRRKGFLKPDKVLRHHQMNCKLDAIRSSFIAKRLADAANGFGIDGMAGLSGGPNGCRPLGEEPIGVAYAPFSSAGAGFASSQLLEGNSSDFMRSTAVDQVAEYPSEGGSPQHIVDTTNLTAANVHYFKQPQGIRVDSGLAAHSSYRLGFDNADDIPLLHGLADKSQHHQHHLSTISSPPPVPPPPPPPSFVPKQALTRCSAPPKQMMQSFGGGHLLEPRLSSGRVQAPQVGPCEWNQRSSTCRPNQLQNKCPINRTTSLGNVNNRHHQQQYQQQHQRLHNHQHHHHRFAALPGCGSRPELVNCIFDGEYESDDEATIRLNHRSLNTPCRRYSTHKSVLNENCRHMAVEDSCSTPSSPERRHKHHHWIHTELDHNTTTAQRGIHQRQARPWKSRGWHHPNTNAVYQADLVHPTTGLNASWRSLGGATLKDQAANDYGSQPDLMLGPDEEALPTPPPPLEDDDDDELVNRRNASLRVEDDKGENSSDLAIAEDLACHSDQLDSDDSYPSQAPTVHKKHRSAPRSDRAAAQTSTVAASPWRTGRQVRRVLLNTGDQHQQTLIDQLQQLDQAKTSAIPSTSNQHHSTKSFDGSLDDFLALPLPVQISALLNRNLNQQQPSGLVQLEEDIVRNLENPNLKGGQKASRKTSGQTQTVKKYPDEQVPNTDSMKRQQIKLNTLQNLINRLQRLHSKTVLECQMDEVASRQPSDSKQDDESELASAGSRYPTQTAKAAQKCNEKVLRRTTTIDSGPTTDQSPPLGSSSSHHQTTGQLKFQSLSRPRSRNSQEVRNLQFDEQTSFPTNNDSVYSMSDSEEAGFVSRMLISTYQQVDVQTSSLDNKRNTTEEKLNKQQTEPPSQDSTTAKQQHHQEEISPS